MKKALTLASFLAVATLGLPISASANETFSWSGTYEGFFVCDDVTAGAPGTFGRPLRIRVAQDGDSLTVATEAVVAKTTGESSAVYSGKVIADKTGTMVSGYLEVCWSDFAYSEIMRLFPASTGREPFGFSASTVFVTEALPGAEGDLVVESCMWSMTRVSTEAPDIKSCP